MSDKKWTRTVRCHCGEARTVEQGFMGEEAERSGFTPVAHFGDMSTKNLRSVLQLMREDKYPNLCTDALSELEAIEKAACHLTANCAKNRLAEYVPGGKDWAKACALMEKIAKEAP